MNESYQHRKKNPHVPAPGIVPVFAGQKRRVEEGPSSSTSNANTNGPSRKRSKVSRAVLTCAFDLLTFFCSPTPTMNPPRRLVGPPRHSRKENHIRIPIQTLTTRLPIRAISYHRSPPPQHPPVAQVTRIQMQGLAHRQSTLLT
jgi:hypothetical protein